MDEDYNIKNLEKVIIEKSCKIGLLEIEMREKSLEISKLKKILHELVYEKLEIKPTDEKVTKLNEIYTRLLRREIDVEGLTVDVGDWVWKKKVKYTFDVVQDTKYGNFIIKDFKKKASYDDLEQCLKVTNGKDYLKNGLRLVCLAEDYDSDILKKYEELMETKKGILPVDLILVNEKGFSVLKISEEIEFGSS